MKGQISFIEYLAALSVFITSVVFIAYQMIYYVPQYLNEVNDERMRINAYQISELLVNDPGDPANWYTSPQIFRLGLSNETLNKTNYVSFTKISAFNNLCSAQGGYDNIKKYVGATENFTILLYDMTTPGPPLIICQPSITFSSLINTSISRIVTIDSNHIGEIIVQSG